VGAEQVRGSPLPNKKVKQLKKSLLLSERQIIVDIEALQTVPGNCNKRIARKVSNHDSKKRTRPPKEGAV
jgi:hypothetical protein